MKYFLYSISKSFSNSSYRLSQVRLFLKSNESVKLLPHHLISVLVSNRLFLSALRMPG